MPVIDPAAIGGIISDLVVSLASYAGIAAILYAIGGILIRTVSWTFDRSLIGFIGFAYKYFEMIIRGTLLSDTVVSQMMNRVYLLVGVFVAFRLGMLLFNYVVNPSEVMDEKVGVNALIKRVVIGMVLIIFMPTIFNFAFRLQKAILDDQIIERVIMSDEEMNRVNKYKEKHGVGKIIGMTIFRGFFSPSSSAGNKYKKNYEKAFNPNQEYDLEILDGDILTESGDDYVYNYFPIFSTVVLIYVLYLLVQYCLDAVVRSLKLSVLQVIAPITIVEYMINGDRNEVFKSWKKAVISTFAMLFMRVISIWFVAYVCMLMQPGMTDSKSLLQDPDYLLKAVIVLGLLAFMMDFPKMMSEIFGLDLDQSGSVKAVMGKAMGAAAAGLAVGGAVAGLGMKAAGATKNTIKGGLTNLAGKDSSFAKGLNNPFKTAGSQLGALAGNTAAGIGALAGKAKNGGSLKDNYKNAKGKINSGIDTVKNSKVGQKASEVGAAFAGAAKDHKLGTTLKAGAMAVGSAALASNSLTKSAAGGYQQTSQAVAGKVNSVNEKEMAEQERAATAAYRQHQMNASDQQIEELVNQNIKLGVNRNIDSATVTGKADALSALGVDVNKDSVVGQLQQGNATAEASQQTLVSIKDDTKVLRENSDDSLLLQLDDSKTLDNINKNTEVTAQNTVSIKEDTKVLRENSDDSLYQQLEDSQTLDNINRNVDVTSKTVAKINNEVETIAGDTAKIADNTMYTGIESIENLGEYEVSATRKSTVNVDNEVSYENGSTTISDTTSGVDVNNLSKGKDQTFETTNKTTVKEINEVETLQENNTSNKKGFDSSNKGPGNKGLLDE